VNLEGESSSRECSQAQKEDIWTEKLEITKENFVVNEAGLFGQISL
jgi:hypothetical protein